MPAVTLGGGGGLGLKIGAFAMTAAKDDNVIDQMKKKSAMDEAMARTLAAMETLPQVGGASHLTHGS